MAVWVIRAGRMGENEKFALKNGVYSVGPCVNQSVCDFVDRKALKSFIPERPSLADELWRFAHKMEVEEMIVMPLRGTKKVAVGRIVGKYLYCYVDRPDESRAPLPHTRKVEWLIKSIPLEIFDEDLQKSFKNSVRNVVKVNEDKHPEERVQQIVDDHIGQE